MEALEGAVVLDKTVHDMRLRAALMLMALSKELAADVAAEFGVPEEISPSEEKIIADEIGSGSRSLQSTSVADLGMSGCGADLSKLTSEMGKDEFFLLCEGEETLRGWSLSALLLDELPSVVLESRFRMLALALVLDLNCVWRASRKACPIFSLLLRGPMSYHLPLMLRTKPPLPSAKLVLSILLTKNERSSFELLSEYSSKCALTIDLRNLLAGWLLTCLPLAQMTLCCPGTKFSGSGIKSLPLPDISSLLDMFKLRCIEYCCLIDERCSRCSICVWL